MQTLRVTQLFVLIALLAPSLRAGDESDPLRRPLPSGWENATEQAYTARSDDDWWKLFGDPTLDSLITLAKSNNYRLEIAARRIDQATQAVRSASAAWYPVVSATAGWNRERRNGIIDGAYSLGLQASWEADIFGKTLGAVRESRYSRDATRAEYDAAMVAVSASVATAYFDLRTAQAQLLVAEAHSEAQDTIVSKAEARHEAGLASKLDVVQARTVLYSTRASVPALHTRIIADVQSIALLCGVYASDIKPALLAHRGIQPDYHRIVSAGVPAELLRRRPDIVAAEANIGAAAAALGVAKKDYLPVLSISGTIGTAATRPGDLFKDGRMTWSVAPTLSWTVFDGFARRAAVASARDEMEAQIASYNSAVQTAYSEVENALTAYTDALRSIDLYKEVVEQSHESLLLSVDLYTQGLSPFSNVVDAQMNYLSSTNSLLSARGTALASLANLYRALGGGFEK